MRPLAQATLAVALLSQLAACAHAPPARSALPEVVWPEPPAAPRVRLTGILPDPDAPLPRRTFWRAAFDLLVGVNRRAERANAFARPFGVALDADGTLLVADPDAQRVVRLDASGTLSDVSCRGRSWGAPLAVARGAAGAIYVADAAAAAVVRWSAAGCAVLGAGAFERPTGVAATPERLYVVDAPRHEVVVLSPGGEVLGRWGGRGEEDGRLSFPTAVAVAPDGTVLVVDALNFRVARFSPDGRWLGSFGTAGETGSGFARPKAVATDESGLVYVSDAQRGLVLVFTAEGVFQDALGEPGEAPGRFVLPAGVAAAGGKLYVADSQNRRIQVFEILGGSR